MKNMSKRRPYPEDQKKPLPSWSRSSTSSTSTSPSDITFTRERGCSRLTAFCAVLSVLMIGLGAAAGVYFGFLSDQLRSLKAVDMKVFRGRLRLTSGDSYNQQLADPSTSEYARKSSFYRTKLDSIFKHSIFRSAFVGTEILGLDGHPDEDLIIHFNLRVDTRNIVVDAGDLFMILAEELRAGEVLSQFEIDHDSLQIQERTDVMSSLPPDIGDDLGDLPRSEEVTSEAQTSRPRQCEPLQVDFCNQLPYNMTSYPNLLGHVDLREVNEHLIAFREVVDSECYRLAHDFVCQLLQPACMSDQLTLPCRDYCHDFYTQCNARLPTTFVDRILCDNFPAHGEDKCLPRPGCVRDLELAGLGARVCDGTPDCGDLSDELGCAACPPAHARCPGEPACVPDSALCDGFPDCTLAGDETGCLSLEPIAGEAAEGVDVQGYLTYEGWGRRHQICAGVNGTNSTDGSSPLDSLDSVCTLLSYRTTRLVEPRLYQNRSADFVQLETEGTPDTASTFRPSDCPSGAAVYIQCSDLACGIAPRQTPLRPDRVSRSGSADFPWQARLEHGGAHTCDATLIDNQWLVTASSCFNGKPRTRWRAVLGVSRLRSAPPQAQTRKVAGMVRSPLEGSTVTLLKLDTDTQDSDHVRPACVVEQSGELEAETDCYTVAWNSTDGEMRYIPVRLAPDSRCDVTGSADDDVTGSRNASVANVTVCAESKTSICGQQLSQLTEMPGAPLLCRPGGPRGAWQLAGVTAGPALCTARSPAPSWRFHTVDLTQAWVVTSIASFENT